MTSDTRITLKRTVTEGDPTQASDFLALHTGLSKARIKDAMAKGAVWLQRKGRGRDRLRRATAALKLGDGVEFFYDPAILALGIPNASCVKDFRHYSIWFKPAGLLTQGTDYGDHCSLLRCVQTYFDPKRDAYPVHRIDREAEGLVVVAHTSDAAARLSRIFQGHEVKKVYRAEVLGTMDTGQGLIDLPLDGKQAFTHYTVLRADMENSTSALQVEIKTGRLHQIRRHLAAIGHPVMGDPRYGKGNRDGRPLRLKACAIEFICPFTHVKVFCSID
jgi:tRNA pseudouridine32 synthase/23S rRNA pseudouridine746 synthase